MSTFTSTRWFGVQMETRARLPALLLKRRPVTALRAPPTPLQTMYGGNCHLGQGGSSVEDSTQELPHPPSLVAKEEE